MAFLEVAALLCWAVFLPIHGIVAVRGAVEHFIIQIGPLALRLVVAAAQVEDIVPFHASRGLVQAILVGACLHIALYPRVVVSNVDVEEQRTIVAHRIKGQLTGVCVSKVQAIVEPFTVKKAIVYKLATMAKAIGEINSRVARTQTVGQ